MLIVEVVPPLLKSLRTSRSPTLCTPLNVPLLLSVTWFWKNQKPCWASPLLSKRSEPKYRTSFEPAGYRAAKLSCRLSLSGRPPDWSFHAQLERSIGSFDPPPVKIVAFCAPSLVNDHAVAPVVSLLVEQSLPSTW